MNISRSLLISAALFLPVAAGAEEWQHFQDMPENKGVYETILIETKGIFYKEVIIWLRASYNLDEAECNRTESSSSNAITYKTICMAYAKNEPKESILKLSLDCSNKTINYLQASSKNHFGKPVSDSLSIGDHPGSLGFSLIQHFCQ